MPIHRRLPLVLAIAMVACMAIVQISTASTYEPESEFLTFEELCVLSTLQREGLVRERRAGKILARCAFFTAELRGVAASVPADGDDVS